jgi:hypothetical protein
MRRYSKRNHNSLLHDSTFSIRCLYDLTVNREGDYSTAEHFASLALHRANPERQEGSFGLRDGDCQQFRLRAPVRAVEICEVLPEPITSQ